MPVPYLEVHERDDVSFNTRGDYAHVPCTIRNIQTAHDAVIIQHSLFEGDRMTFHQILTSRDDKLDRFRPIRFYNQAGGAKLFDGFIDKTNYAYIGKDYMALEIKAVGWWRELSRMNLHVPITYDATKTVNEIYTDLVRMANNMGVMKEAVYKYDTSKIPEYMTYSNYYEQATGTTFVFNSVYEGMQTLTQYLDAAIPNASEFGLRIEALPRIDGISQAETETGIYILPFPINSDKAVEPAHDTTWKRFKLDTGLGSNYSIKRDYSQLANDCFAIGAEVRTQQIGSVKILEEKTISGVNYKWPRDAQVLASHYLRVTLENTTGSLIAGRIEIMRVSGTSNPVEKFPIQAPAYGTQTYYTSERTEDGLPHTGVDCFETNGLTGCKITVEEITSDASPFYTTIAGNSLNTYGYAGKMIEALWLDNSNTTTAQDMVNNIACKHCYLYHTPLHRVHAPIINRYVSYENLIGNTAYFYSPYEVDLKQFLVTDAFYGFKGTQVTQQLAGMRFEYDWDYTDA